MNIFNSLGSNYDFLFVLKALFAKSNGSFRSALKSYLEKKYNGTTILVYKGREAIELALEILSLPKGSFVAINGFTCYAVYRAVKNEGYETELLDLDSSLNLNFSAELLNKRIKQNPTIQAVIVQNTLGYPCNIEKIAKVCRENNIILIEDLAHSVGLIYANGKEAGTIGDFVVLSFSQDKIIDAVSGGALIIRNKKYADRFRHSSNQSGMTLTAHPQSPDTKSDSGQDGYQTVTRQAKMTDIDTKQQLLDRLYPLFTFVIRKTYKAGVGKVIHLLLKAFNLLSKPMQESFYAKYNLPNWYSYLVLDNFKNLNKNLAHRKEIASVYNSTLDKKVTSDNINSNIQSSANLRYPIFVDNRKSLIEYLEQEGVYVYDIWYDSVSEKCNNCKIAADKILNLPTHKNVSAEDAKLLSKKINQWLQSP